MPAVRLAFLAKGIDGDALKGGYKTGRSENFDFLAGVGLPMPSIGPWVPELPKIQLALRATGIPPATWKVHAPTLPIWTQPNVSKVPVLKSRLNISLEI